MSNLKYSSEAIGPEILRITFSGYYPPGSEGNPVAGEMITFVEKTVAEQHPTAILFDLTELNYRWGDAICGIIRPLINNGWDVPLRSVCVIATGETRKAIRPLFELNWAFGRFGVRLFEDEQAAVRSLQSAK